MASVILPFGCLLMALQAVSFTKAGPLAHQTSTQQQQQQQQQQLLQLQLQQHAPSTGGPATALGLVQAIGPRMTRKSASDEEANPNGAINQHHMGPASNIIQALGQYAAQQVVSNGGSLFAQNPTSGGEQQTLVAAAQNGGNAATGTSANSQQFVIKLIHTDPKTNQTYVSVTQVNNTNLHEPRIELRYQSKFPFVSLDERTPNNTVVAAVVVNDEDSGPNGETTLNIERGNELGHFKLVSTQFTNTIQVNGAPLSRHRNAEYNLTIVARDHGSPPKSSSSNLLIRLHAQNSGTGIITGTSVAPLEPQPSSKPPVTDLMYFGAMLVVTFFILVLLIIFGCALFQRPKNKTHKGPPLTMTGRSRSGTSSRALSADPHSAYCSNLTRL